MSPPVSVINCTSDGTTRTVPFGQRLVKTVRNTTLDSPLNELQPLDIFVVNSSNRFFGHNYNNPSKFIFFDSNLLLTMSKIWQGSNLGQSSQ